MTRMKRKRLVLDFGNARGKAHDSEDGILFDFRHAIALLKDHQWKEIVGRSKPPTGIIKVNGVPYAIGDSARRYVIKERPKGAGRYTEDYYGIALAYAMAEVFQENCAGVSLYASFPPGDVKYARNIERLAKQRWEVVSQHGTLDFVVDDVGVFDEPLGGYSHFVLTQDGSERKKNPLSDKTTLVIDVGGHTVDIVPIDPGGQIDYLGAKSTRAGVLKMLNDFEEEMKSNNASMFMNSGDLDQRRVEKALLDGTYRFGKINIDCKRESDAAINSLVNDVRQIITEAGGEANFDTMLVTGGGGSLLFDALEEAMPRAEFILAEQDRDKMMFANVLGGGKLFKMLRAMGMA